jgi:hypothetical protein
VRGLSATWSLFRLLLVLLLDVVFVQEVVVFARAPPGHDRFFGRDRP